MTRLFSILCLLTLPILVAVSQSMIPVGQSVLVGQVLTTVPSAGGGGATTVISDTFNRTGILFGSSPTIPDPSNPSETWNHGGLHATTATTGGGQLSIAGYDEYNALPLTLLTGHIYTITVTQTITSGSGVWGAVGFSSPSGGVHSYDQNGPWILVDETGAWQSFYNGTSTSLGTGSGFNAAGTANLVTVVVNTTPTPWTVSMSINGTQVVAPTNLPGGFAIDRIFVGYGGLVYMTDKNLLVTIQ